MRRVIVVGGIVSVIAVVGIGAFIASLFMPYFLDDRALDRAVVVVAQDWRDFGEEAALERMMLELNAADIGLHVQDDDCVLEAVDGVRSVSCTWGVEVAIPGTETIVPLAFQSRAMVDPEGNVR